VLVLALDTATEAVVVGLVTVDDRPPVVLAERVYPGARQHGEQLMPAVLEVCAAAGRGVAELDAVVCGAGPGPFTGLRVGLVTAAGLGDALDVPVHGVCSLDAIAEAPIAEPAVAEAPIAEMAVAEAGRREPLLVVADARRRELYWAAYGRDGRRLAGPAVHPPADVASRVPELGVRRVAGPVAAAYAESFGLPEHPWPGAALAPTAAGLVAAAAERLRSGCQPDPLEPIYLRRPDAVPPGERKRAVPPGERARPVPPGERVRAAPLAEVARGG
jgi:tRNA threonylcarbamoyl adenosine modification protein YeaZ